MYSKECNVCAYVCHKHCACVHLSEPQFRRTVQCSAVQQLHPTAFVTVCVCSCVFNGVCLSLYMCVCVFVCSCANPNSMYPENLLYISRGSPFFYYGCCGFPCSRPRCRSAFPHTTTETARGNRRLRDCFPCIGLRMQ